jgi:hypothetical protein
MRQTKNGERIPIPQERNALDGISTGHKGGGSVWRRIP